jgi:DNA-binding MarR family transcriptional regulator
MAERLSVMLEERFLDVYTKFKLFFYQTVFSRFEGREASLTTVETFCMETIYALREPTINEFANFMHISSPNAAYKINSLIKKGYVEKIRSESDRREYHLRPTQKYLDYSDINHNYIRTVLQRLKDRIPSEDQDKLEDILTIISNELMPEVSLPKRP